jgi:hypothetical protein
MSDAELRALLDAHPERLHASVWRPGMLDWRPAAGIIALTQGAPTHEPWSAHPEAPLVEPRRVSVPAPRDASGELRVLSYAEPPMTDPGRAVAPATRAPTPEISDSAPSVLPTRTVALSGEWATVATDEFRAVDSNKLQAASPPQAELDASREWNRVATSEFRVVETSELRVLAMKQPSAPATLRELRAIPKQQLLGDSALPSRVISEPTAAELPIFRFLAEPAGAACDAPEPATITPPPLPPLRPAAVGKDRPSRRAWPLVVGGLLLLCTLALLLILLR